MQPVILVSGLPRSGTSMMMKMLAAGGVEIYTDQIRQPDEDNPQGYYEVEKVKELYKDATWMRKLQGGAVKVISFLLYHVPVSMKFKVIFMQREMSEILQSQQKMLARANQQTTPDEDEALAQKFTTHLAKIVEWLGKQRNMDCLYVNYNQVLADPRPVVAEIQRFLELPLNTEAMLAAVDASLYRNRKNA